MRNLLNVLNAPGSGEVRYVQKSFLGQVVNVQPCSSCSGLVTAVEEFKKQLKSK